MLGLYNMLSGWLWRERKGTWIRECKESSCRTWKSRKWLLPQKPLMKSWLLSFPCALLLHCSRKLRKVERKWETLIHTGLNFLVSGPLFQEGVADKMASKGKGNIGSMWLLLNPCTLSVLQMMEFCLPKSRQHSDWKFKGKVKTVSQWKMIKKVGIKIVRINVLTKYVWKSR